MKFLACVLLIGFFSLSIFGFVGMLESSDMSHAQNTCLASLAQNGACPPPENTVASALFHTDAFKVFSTFLLSSAAVLLSFALLCVGFAMSLVLFQDGLQTLAGRIEHIILRYLALRKLRPALVRLEHSPTSF